MSSALLIIAVLSITVIDASKEIQFLPVLPIGCLNPQDRTFLLDIFRDYNRSSLKEAHYALIGNSVFGLHFVNDMSCESLKPHFDSSDAEAQYYALSIAAGIESCKAKVSFPDRLKNALKDDDLTLDRLYYLVSSATIANVRLDKAHLLKLLTDFAAKEAGPSSLSTILALAAMVQGATNQELEAFSPLVVKLIEQADEADGITLFFERGAYATAFAMESVFNFAKALKRLPTLTEEQVIKFANFLYERRRSNQIRTAAYVASAFRILTTNDFMTPVVVYGETESERAGVSGILVTHLRRLRLRLFDVFGTGLNSLMAIHAGALHSVSESASNKTISSASLGEFKLDPSIDAFELNLGEKAGPIPRGRYTLEIKIMLAKNGTTMGNKVTNAKIPLRVVSPLKLDKAHIKLSDSTKTLVDSPLVSPWGRHPEVLVLHRSSRLHITFALEDAVIIGTKSSPPPQQVFVQLSHWTGHQSVTFITKRSTVDETYAFTLSLDSVAENFDYASGMYKLDVLIGDSLVESPVVWHVADVDLHFPLDEDLSILSQPDDNDVARLTVASNTARKRPIHPLVGYLPSVRKPQLEHTFRTPEPRPSNLLAFTFTALCCAPLVVLLITWPIMGANLANFSFNLPALFFHLGLAGIFGLYLAYWLKLNMFQTLRYLLFLGIVTFVAGNRLLRKLVSNRHKVQG